MAQPVPVPIAALDFYTNERVSEIRGDGRPSGVVTRSGRELPCDFVCVGIGIVPNLELAQQAGLAIRNGGSHSWAARHGSRTRRSPSRISCESEQVER